MRDVPSIQDKVLAALTARLSDDSTLRPPVRDTHLRDMREVGRRREFEDELPARRIPAFELLERVADVAAEDDRAFVGLHDDDLMSGRVSRRR